MADKPYVAMTVECQNFKTKQKVHVAARTGFAQMGGEDDLLALKCVMHHLEKFVERPSPVNEVLNWSR
jgi:hypothetical protein